MMGHRQRRRIEMLASDLADRSVEDSIETHVLEQAVEAMLGSDLTRLACDMNDATGPVDDTTVQQRFESNQNYHILVKSVRRAATKCKQSNANKKTKKTGASIPPRQEPKSVSLLSSMEPVSFQFVTVEQIQEAQSTSPEELRKVLNKIQHVDDVMHAWEDTILPILYNGLLRQTQEYMQMCRKWFRQSNTQSMEHVLVRSDICHTVARAVGPWVERKNGENLYLLLQLWHDMWTELLPYLNMLPSDKNDDMAALIWSQFQTDSVVPQLLAIVDPYSQWFACWTCQMQPLALAKLLRKHSSLVPYLIGHCRHDAFSPQDSYLKELVELLHKHNMDDNILRDIVLVQSLCMLRSILVVTRVSLFPWDLVVSPLDDSAANNESSSETMTEVEPTLVQLQSVLELYMEILEVGIVQPSLVQERLAQLSGVAVETILQGCYHRESYVSILISVVLDRLLSVQVPETEGKTDNSSLEPCKRVVLHVWAKLLRDVPLSQETKEKHKESLRASISSWLPQEALEESDLLDLLERLLDGTTGA